ncbi:hypothetical protein T10_11004 [Trichinella papuae]|uniref:Uncharacterized protein n=1 Tax=Trichinella papuae TaxID=268474 RepID=A0A0V1N7L0_9BILA|nr:hypothetical protein T10_11004 [Trichinella papuae]
MHLHEEKHKATCESSLALSDKGKYTNSAQLHSDAKGCSKLKNSPTSESKEQAKDTLSVGSSNKYCPLPNFVQLQWRLLAGSANSFYKLCIKLAIMHL